ncbi:hypothetical protein BOX37_13205 [Nocardia mangyaensis]|uniref:DUF5134 domain-containing protein n=1 Tax=Nocardia mangyaensis TaxID=2213200 RepID=A0A1J0VRV7_9NOCA|nr:hypothetical protein BOX37_13205 [Nocardia mangyaensis]
MAAMIAGCMLCALHLWSLPSVRDWTLAATMNLGMIAIHIAMAGDHSTHQMPHHGPSHSGLSTVPLDVALLVATTESVLAIGVLVWRSVAAHCGRVGMLTALQRLPSTSRSGRTIRISRK